MAMEIDISVALIGGAFALIAGITTTIGAIIGSLMGARVQKQTTELQIEAEARKFSAEGAEKDLALLRELSSRYVLAVNSFVSASALGEEDKHLIQLMSELQAIGTHIIICANTEIGSITSSNNFYCAKLLKANTDEEKSKALSDISKIQANWIKSVNKYTALRSLPKES